MKKDINLAEQLLIVFIIVIGIIVVSLGVILPNNLIPIYETNVYNYLRQPLSFVQNEDDVSNTKINTEIAYIYIDDINNIGAVSISTNLTDIIKINDIKVLLDKIDFSNKEGNFVYKTHKYYYVLFHHNEILKSFY